VCRSARRLVRAAATVLGWRRHGRDTSEVTWLDGIEPDELAG
jgi:hypothetical protein